MKVATKFNETFDKALAEEHQNFSLMEYFGLEKKDIGLRPIGSKQKLEDSEIPEIVEAVKKFHEFVSNNQNKLTHLKIDFFEALYPTNKFGLPLHIIERDKILNEKVKEIKTLVKNFVPIEKKHLEGIEKALANRDINNRFFKYIIRKRKEMPELKLKGGKLFVPDTKNIVKIHKEYVMRQFYMENGEYHVMWIGNFYES